MTTQASTDSSTDNRANAPTKTAVPALAAKPPVPAKRIPARATSPFGAPPKLANPFAAEAPAEAAETPDDEAYYAIVPTAASAPVDEVDAPAAALEVTVLWGERDVLHVAHLTPPRAFVVGEAVDRIAPDLLMEGEFLGTSRYPVTRVENGTTFVLVPAGAEVTRRTSEVTSDRARLVSEGALRESTALAGASEVALGAKDTIRVQHKGFTFQVRSVPAGKRVGTAVRPDARPLGYVGVVGAFFGLLFTIGAFMAPGGGQLTGETLDLESRYVQALLVPPETTPADAVTPTSNAADAAGTPGGRAAGDEGEAGRPDHVRTQNRAAQAGDAPRDEQRLASTTSVERTQNAGALGVLASLAGAFAAPTSPYGAETAIGSDPTSAIGALLGVQIGENAGGFGLGMRGTGIGANGQLVGTIGLSTFDTVGTVGTPDGRPGEYGRNVGGWIREPGAVRPQVRPSPTVDVTGSLAQDVIRRVIQRHLSEVSFCYEQGLTSDPSLAGRVTVRFLISGTGAVQTSMVANSTLASPNVGSCIANAVRRWSFPAPEGGLVIVSYPFTLTPAATP